jgi:hypothetical protein
MMDKLVMNIAWGLSGLLKLAVMFMFPAMILRAVCALFNKLAGSDGVPEPRFGKALAITCLTIVLSFFTEFFLALVDEPRSIGRKRKILRLLVHKTCLIRSIDGMSHERMSR